jgi:hypothetical protein
VDTSLRAFTHLGHPGLFQSHMQALVASGLEPKSSLHTSGAVLVDANGHTAITVADTLSPAGMMM